MAKKKKQENTNHILLYGTDIYGRNVFLCKDDSGYWVEHHKSGNGEEQAANDLVTDYMDKDAAERKYQECVNDGSFL